MSDLHRENIHRQGDLLSVDHLLVQPLVFFLPPIWHVV